MEIKSVKIGNIVTKNNVFLAPLAGYSDAALRVICLDYGAGLAFTEMVSCKGLKYGSEKSEEILFTYPEEEIKAVQIFGNDPDIMGEIASSKYLEKFDIIDINMGCPVPKIYNNGEGSALLKNPKLASKIISSVKKSGKAVTVKFRIGLTDGEYVTETFAKACEDGGADMITVHGRVKTAIYSGEPNYNEIEKAKKAVKIPVIANGGIFTKQDADIMIERTGADGVMVARGAMNNPSIFSDILLTPNPLPLKEQMLKHLKLLKDRYGSERTAIIFRKQMAFYLKGLKDGKRLKEIVFSAKDASEIERVILSIER